METRLVCPVCCSDRYVSWGNKNGYSLLKCRACTHRFADVRGGGVLHDDPDEFRTRFTHNLMKSDADYYRHLCVGEQPSRHTRETAKRIIDKLDRVSLPASRRWLDIGCGSGHLLAEASKHGWNAVGIEPGGWGQIAAREKGVNIIQGFLDRHTFDGHFGCISATDVLEHQPDPYVLMELIKFYLDPVGVAFVSVPYADSFHGKLLRYRWSMVDPPTHCHFFTRRSFETLVSRAGMTLADMMQFNMSYAPLLGYTRAGRSMSDWLLQHWLGGDQAVFLMRNRI